MASKIPPINVRLPDDLGERFQSLRREFPGLSSSTIVRALLSPQLARPMAEQVELVISSLRKTKTERTAGNSRLGLATLRVPDNCAIFSPQFFQISATCNWKLSELRSNHLTRQWAGESKTKNPHQPLRRFDHFSKNSRRLGRQTHARRRCWRASRNWTIIVSLETAATQEACLMMRALWSCRSISQTTPRFNGRMRRLRFTAFIRTCFDADARSVSRTRSFLTRLTVPPG